MNIDEFARNTAMLEAQVAALTQRLEEQERQLQKITEERNLLRAAFEVMPVGVRIVDANKNVDISNVAAKSIWGDTANSSDASSAYELFLPDGVTKTPPERDPIQRALRGQAVDDMECILGNIAASGETKWMLQSARPIIDSAGETMGCVAVTRDITEHKSLLRELDEIVATTVDENRLLIEKLEAGVKKLSTPMIEVWDDVLALPVIGNVDEQRGAEMTARVLDEVVDKGIRWVIVDWTGVESMDSQSAQHLLNLVQAVELVGAECILTGIRPAVASALLQLDVRFEHLRLLRNVKFGLRYCLGRLRPNSSKSKNQAKSTGSSSSTH